MRKLHGLFDFTFGYKKLNYPWKLNKENSRFLSFILSQEIRRSAFTEDARIKNSRYLGYKHRRSYPMHRELVVIGFKCPGVRLTSTSGAWQNHPSSHRVKPIPYLPFYW